jgi:peptidoglycan/xylan/chitin deacetylase (PgdA/CDA1 family)
VSRHDHHDDCTTCARYSRLGRRRFLETLGFGLAVYLGAGCSGSEDAEGGPATVDGATAEPTTSTTTSTTTTTIPKVVDLDQIPPARPGPASTITKAPTAVNQIALTIDDGTCKECVDAYVSFALTSGVHITFSPNGSFDHLWDPHAPVLRPLIEAGQVQIANHTFNHPNLKQLSDAKISEELERNDEWVRRVFGITTRPWYRPPYGYHNGRVDGVAGGIGYTNVLMWNGSFGDARSLPPDVLMGEARKWMQPGTVMLGHANHPTVIDLFDEIQALMAERSLTPVTLDEMFGTSRRTG